MGSSQKLTIIGDVHGKIHEYHSITQNCSHSFQLGDFGFDKTLTAYGYLGIDATKHRFGQGNHDDHNLLIAGHFPAFVGRFGSNELNGLKFFWVGGAASIDIGRRLEEWLQDRRKPLHWWSNEELTRKEMAACTASYEMARPSLVISHECPDFLRSHLHDDDTVVRMFGFQPGWASVTSQFLAELHAIHAPSMWVFGHHHRSWNMDYRGTHFICLNELETLEI